MNSTHHTPDDHHPDDFSRRLRSRFDVELTDLPAGSGPEAAVARAHSRRRHRRTVLASAAALAVIAGASSQALTDDPGESEIATASQSAVVDRSLTFDWTTTEGGLVSADRYAAGESGLYVLSTAPGNRSDDAPRAMYRLGDDGTWTPIALEGDDPRVSTLSERGGALYALSTGPASGADGGPTGSVSTDGGETWSSVPLETPTPPSDAVAWTVSYSMDIASTADNTVALVSAQLLVPYEDLFPELSSGHDYSYNHTQHGIDLVRVDTALEEQELERAAAEAAGNPAVADPEGGPFTTAAPGAGEVVRTVTWADLGISGPDDLTPQRWAYAADGDEWNQIAVPSTDSTAHTQWAQIATVGDRLLLTVEQYSDDGPTTVDSYLSEDGQDWATIEGPGAGQLLAAGDSLLYVGYSHDEGDVDVVQVSHDLGATWTPIDLRSLDPAIESVPDDLFVDGSAGPLGVALTVYRGDERPPLLLFSTDLESWSITDLAEIMPEGGYFGGVLVGADRVAILRHSNDGEKGSPERTGTLVGVPRNT